MYYLIQNACQTISQNEKNLYPTKKVKTKEDFEEIKTVLEPPQETTANQNL